LRLQEGAGRRIEVIVRLRRPLEELVEFLSCQAEVVATRLEGGTLNQLDRAGEDGSLSVESRAATGCTAVRDEPGSATMPGR